MGALEELGEPAGPQPGLLRRHHRPRVARRRRLQDGLREEVPRPRREHVEGHARGPGGFWKKEGQVSPVQVSCTCRPIAEYSHIIPCALNETAEEMIRQSMHMLSECGIHFSHHGGGRGRELGEEASFLSHVVLRAAVRMITVGAFE